jgi:endo-1,4-beta-D-glucanase Y
VSGRLLALLAAIVVVAAGCGSPDAGDEPADDGPPAAATRFLERFVDADGRVVRRDQGGDTVSEGQAYALLVAAALEDERRFDRVWRWTQEHLQRDDGLLSWRWRDGKVVDPQPAADADLDAADALLRAADAFDRPALRREGVRIARAALAAETVDTPAGPLLVAGPWARERRVVNPSYLAPGLFAALGGRWEQGADAARTAIATLLDEHRLVPDWATVERDGSVGAAEPPNGGAPPQYGYEAVRAPLRLAAACADERSRALAARMWDVLQDEPARLPRGLDGTAWGGEASPALVAAAGAAAAAGNSGEADRLLDQADEREKAEPTYFGSALLALARTAWTPGC